MKIQRSMGLALIALQTAALACFFHTYLFSAAMFIAAMVGTVTRRRIATPESARRWPIIQLVLYLVQRFVLPPTWQTGVQSFLISDACLIAQYFVVYQTALFFVRRDDDRLPGYLPILAIVAMVFTGDVRVSDPGRTMFQVAVLALAILSIAFWLACRTMNVRTGNRLSARRSWLMLLIALASCVVGWATASGLYRYARQIEMAMGAVLNPSLQAESAGFSGRGRLGSVSRQKGTSGDRIALRMFAHSSPVYLRGRAFDAYDKGQWVNTTSTRSVGRGQDGRFPLSDGRGKELLEVWPDQPFREVVFTPLAASQLDAPVERLSIDGHDVVTAEGMPAKRAYRIWTSDGSRGKSGPFVLSNDDRKRLTALPDELDPRIRELAIRVTAGLRTSGERIAAIQAYMLENYEYQFGITIPDQTDPLTYFLLEKPPAHCEYFASGAAVLLRSVGVPCRYVVGYTVAERNDYGGYWIARNRDAHAWVEAFDSERGWVTVEATPVDGLSQRREVSALAQMWDALRAAWQRFVARVREEGVVAIIAVLKSALLHPITWLALVAAGLLYFFRRYAVRRTRAARISVDPWVARVRAELDRMDRRWKKAGLARQPDETPHQFAVRIEQAGDDEEHRTSADWYRRFAVVRYGGPTTADRIRGLCSGDP